MKFNLLILGAGRGARLSPLTDQLPKPLLSLQGPETIFLRLVKQFRNYLPISNIWVNISTHSEVFLHYLSEIHRGLRPKILFEPNLLGAANTLFELSKIDDGATLVIHGDLVISYNYVESLIREISQNPRFIVFCHSRESKQARSQIIINNSNLVTKLINHHPIADIRSPVMVNSGIYFFPSLQHIGIAPTLGTEIAESILQTLIKLNQLYALEIEHERISVDSFEQLEAARNFIKGERLDQ